MFEKIGEGINSVVPEPKEHHSAALTSNGKLWLVGLTGARQDKYSYYHQTSLLGGYVVCFNINAKKWEGPWIFPEIDKDENREDLVFAVGEQLYMLIYSRYDGFQVRDLLVYNDQSHAWDSLALNADDASKLSDNKGRCEVVHTIDGNNVYLAVTEGSVSGRVHVSKLTVGAGAPTLSYVGPFPDGLRMFPGGNGWIVKIAVSGPKLHAISGSMGCGFRWEPQRIITFDLESKAAAAVDLESEPPFGYGGPSAAGVINNKWIMLDGEEASGMTDSTPLSDVWYLDLAQIGWHKMPFDMPSGLAYGHSTIVGSDSVAISDKSGVYVYRA